MRFISSTVQPVYKYRNRRIARDQSRTPVRRSRKQLTVFVKFINSCLKSGKRWKPPDVFRFLHYLPSHLPKSIIYHPAQNVSFWKVESVSANGSPGVIYEHLNSAVVWTGSINKLNIINGPWETCKNKIKKNYTGINTFSEPYTENSLSKLLVHYMHHITYLFLYEILTHLGKKSQHYHH